MPALLTPNRAAWLAMSLPQKTHLFVQEARRQRARAIAAGRPVAPPPTKEQLVALATWAEQKEKQQLAAGLGQAAQGAASGATAGASIGMVAGPWGAAIGAVVGGVAGAITGRSAQKKAEKSAKEAKKTAKLGVEAARTQAAGQTKAASLVLEAEKVKADAAKKFPAWAWAGIAIGGVLLLSGTVYYVMQNEPRRRRDTGPTSVMEH